MWESKAAPLSGVLAVALVVVSTLIIGNYDFMPAAGDVAVFFGERNVSTGAFVGLLGAFMFLWFAGSVHDALVAAAPRHALLAALGAGFTSMMLSIGYVALIAGAERARLRPPLDPSSASSLFDLSSISVGTAAGVGLAVLIGASSVGRLQAGTGSKPAAWVGIVIALGLISPISYIVLGFGMIWVAVVSIQLYRRQPTYQPD